MSNKKESLLLSFSRFLKKPTYTKSPHQEKNSTKLWNLFRLFALASLLTFILGVLVNLILEMNQYDASQHAIVDLIHKQEIWYLIIMGSLWAPIVEELTFRMGLRYSAKSLGFAIILLLLIFFNSIMEFLFPAEEEIVEEVTTLGSQLMPLFIYLAVVAVLGFILGQFLHERLNTKKMEAWYEKHFWWLFYGTSIIFALIHISNYANLGKLWYFTPILVAPQFIIGLILGYIRMRYGLKWAMGYHAFHNSILLVPILLIWTFVVTDEFRQAILNEDEAAMESILRTEPFITGILGIIGLMTFAFIVFILVGLIHLIWEYFHYKKPQTVIREKS